MARGTGYNSAVASVLYNPHGSVYVETKGGSYIYHGEASSFFEWEFRTRLRLHGKKDEQYSEHMSLSLIHI